MIVSTRREKEEKTLWRSKGRRWNEESRDPSALGGNETFFFQFLASFFAKRVEINLGLFIPKSQMSIS